MALPGAPPLPDGVRAELARALATRPGGYVPRTKHRRADGSPIYTNRLLLEPSPYLQQHAHNPVNWFPWGDEAFAEAKRLNRPVLVSIGYSTCHWCHVMEEESFDDPETAAYLNAHFVAVKVDREARPDVDSVYMAATHALGQRGGWPLNVFVTPAREPFFAGTYFPPEDRGGRMGFPTLLRTVHEQYSTEPERVAGFAGRLADAVRQSLEGVSADASRVPAASTLTRAATSYAARVDPVWGGIGEQTKFPSTVPVRLLLRVHRRSGDERALRAATLTLEKMAAGGMRDHVGGGFHRYSTDPRWLVPHFEKMLYDNALLALAYLEAGHATGREDFTAVARDVLRYVAREMTSDGGAFYSATDADSASPEGHMEEGLFFTWTPAEIDAALGDERGRIARAWYGVTEAGDLEGRSVLRTWRDADAVAAELGIAPAALARTVEDAREDLYRARAKRPPPLRDEKVLVAWNGLMISAFARAGLLLDDPDATARARRAAEFVLTRMRSDGRLRRVFQDGRASGPAFLEDYAFLIAGLLDLYEASPDPRWLREAIALQATLDRYYADELGGAYFKTADDHERLLAREKPSQDAAVPSGNSVAALNLLRLAEFTGDDAYRERVAMLFSAFYERITASPTTLPEMLVALDFHHDRAKEIVLVAPEGAGGGAAPLVDVVRSVYAPNRILAVVTEGPDLAAHAEVVPLVRASARSQAAPPPTCARTACASTRPRTRRSSPSSCALW